MQHTITLSILGRPVQFAPQCRVEGCLNPLHKGPCKGFKRGVGDAVKKAAKKTTAKKAAPAKATGKKATSKKAVPKAPTQSDADRVAQVKKMTAKPLHHGFKMSYIIDRLAKLAKSFGNGSDGDGEFDRDKMIVRITSKHGTGEMRMTPQGWQTTVTRANSAAPRIRNFRDVESAAMELQGLRFFQPPPPR